MVILAVDDDDDDEEEEVDKEEEPVHSRFFDSKRWSNACERFEVNIAGCREVDGDGITCRRCGCCGACGGGKVLLFC